MAATACWYRQRAIFGITCSTLTTLTLTIATLATLAAGALTSATHTPGT